MSLRYYVFGGVALLCAFYYSREIRDLVSSREIRDPSLPSWQPESPAGPPRYVASPPVPEAKRVLQRFHRWSSPCLTGGDVLHEKTALEEWIQSRLTQQGLKEMTEADHWQSESSRAL